MQLSRPSPRRLLPLNSNPSSFRPSTRHPWRQREQRQTNKRDERIIFLSILAVDYSFLYIIQNHCRQSSSEVAMDSLTAMVTTTAAAATTTDAIPNPSTLLAAVSSLPTSSYTADGTPDEEGSSECRLLGPFSLLVQAALGALALLSLVYKRWRERPQRPVKVWAFDVSKQVFGSAMLHLANLLMSMFSAGQFEITSTYKPNPCSFYLLNLGIDVSWILCVVLRLISGN